MPVQIRKASRQKVKIKLAFEGPAGSGKTMSALLTAKGLCDDWEKIVVIDTENKSADLYEHLGAYSVIELTPPFSPERFIEAIKAAYEAGFEAIIIDSASAEWIGEGGILETHSSMAGNSFTNWGKLTPRHQAFINTILQTPVHVICNLRTKTEYVLVEKNGKQVPEKVGMKAETRDNLDYEMTVVFTLDIKNNAVATKDRTGLFFNRPQFIVTEQTGKMIKEWCESGLDLKQAVNDAIANLQNCKSVEDLTMFKETLDSYIIADASFKQAGRDRYNEINKRNVVEAADEMTTTTEDETHTEESNAPNISAEPIPDEKTYTNGSAVSDQALNAEKPWLNMNTTEYSDIVECLRNETMTLNDVAMQFRINKDVRAELQEVINNLTPGYQETQQAKAAENAEKPWLDKGSKKYDLVVERLKNKTTTLSHVAQFFKLNKDVRAELIAIVNEGIMAENKAINEAAQKKSPEHTVA